MSLGTIFFSLISFGIGVAMVVGGPVSESLVVLGYGPGIVDNIGPIDCDALHILFCWRLTFT